MSIDLLTGADAAIDAKAQSAQTDDRGHASVLRNTGFGARPTHVIGVDLGGTKLLGGLADAKGCLLATLEEPTRHGRDAPVIAQIGEMARALVQRAGLGSEAVLSMVIGVPSAVSPASGLASLSPNLALPEDRPLADLVAEQVPFAVQVENDVNLAAFGEAMAEGSGFEGPLVFVSFGTGVGMGLVINHQLVRGAFGRAGEIAYLPIGATPHVDAVTSENGLYEDRVGTGGILKVLARPGETVAGLFLRAEAGQADALEAIDHLARSASIGIACVQSLIDPVQIVIGGGIGSQTLFMERLRHHVGPLLPFDCRMAPSRFGTQAGLVGAVMYAMHLAGGTVTPGGLASAGRLPDM
ncbi:ROK family protein [Rhizobium sp. FY34]|uniref:ROK family protein n=1 Tax=Rhizobium sp. FY34 TaxID=2562309 RepID=UPI001FF016A6|nr:ROK family protein [Rhizobium sp. FY34]